MLRACPGFPVPLEQLLVPLSLFPVPSAAWAEGQSSQLPLEREPRQPRHWDEVLAPAQGVGKLSHLSPLPQN